MRPKKPPMSASANESGRSTDPSLPAAERTVRLAELELAVKNGTYRIATECVADKLIMHLRNTAPKA